MVTGFGPFGPITDNPSARLAWAIAAAAEGSVGAAILPVSHRGAAGALDRAIARHTPVLTALFGVAADRRTISVERVARNQWSMSVADCDGWLPDSPTIDPKLPTVLATPLDAEGLAADLRSHALAAETSDDAGAYVCNSTYFHAIASGLACVFVHIPADAASRGQASPDAPLAVLAGSPVVVSAILECLRNLAESTHQST